MATIINSASGRILAMLLQTTPTRGQSEFQAALTAAMLFEPLCRFGHQDFNFIVLVEKDFDVCFPESAQFLTATDHSGSGLNPMELMQRIRTIKVDFDMGTFQYESFASGLFQQDSFPDWHRFYEFVQDPFVVMVGPEESVVLLEPYYAWTRRSPEDCNAEQANGNMLLSKFLPEVLSSASETLIRATPWYFQGGNILADSGIAFIGEDIVKKNLRAYEDRFANTGNPVEAFLDEFRKTLGVEVLICPGLESGLDSWRQIPCQDARLYHLDTWLTLGGKSEDGCQIVFVAQLHVERGGTWEVGFLNPRDTIQGYLDIVVARLKAITDNSGTPIFQVYRIPMLDTLLGTRSYNNSIVEVSESIKQVFMPVYAFYERETDTPMNPSDPFVDADNKAVAAFEQAGFTVRKLEGFGDFGKAGPHCYSLVTRRENRTPNSFTPE